MNNIERLVEEYFMPEGKKSVFNLQSLLEIVEEVISSPDAPADEVVAEQARTRRFSETIDIPILTPSEAWGDPGSQSRAQITKIFRSVSGGRNIQERIKSINGYLDVKSAKRRRAVGRLINMMMVIEALQATLNDYNESAAGFVFEGFMAALTGGRQVAGKVAGTLPIEDFVAFSEYGGASVPVSLKLLSGSTPIKGSFTNIVDFLTLRGSTEIKYIVAYKKTAGDIVEKLSIYEFTLNLDNFVDFILNTSKGAAILGGVDSRELKAAFAAFKSEGEAALYRGDGTGLAELVVNTAGYQRAGLLYKWMATKARGEEPAPGEPGGRPLTPEEEAEAQAAADARRADKYARVQEPRLQEALDHGTITLFEAFHYIEKQSLLAEAEGVSQWAASFPQLEKLSDTVDLVHYGEIDLSQNRIDELTEIYSEKIQASIGNMLTALKGLTENVKEYYSAKNRSKGAAAAATAESQQIPALQGELEADPLSRRGEK